MKFSIIVPVYKVEQYLNQCIESVLIQTFKSYELILVDDGSPDGSPEICDKYASNCEQISVIHKMNGGQSSARNAGLDVARGEYVLFLDSDDWWDDNEALKKLNDQLDISNADVLIFGMKKYFMLKQEFDDIRIPLCDVDDNITKEQFYKKIMERNIFVASAWDKVLARSIIEKYHLRFVTGQLSEDIEWCAKLLLCQPKIDILKEAFYVYRQQNSVSITANISRKNVFHVCEIIKMYAKKNAPLPLKHYLANQLILLMSFSRKVNQSDIKDVMDNIKNYWWLTEYDWYPYVRKVSKLKFLGFNAIRYLLGCYHKYKRGL